ncbi:hypothetical protein N9A94_07035 [Akkermansiaceae bacterium]|nr:hypothetical protein [Akkermansiaceae bacterium]MDA7888004.1 hypothetical protein [Akkermansiaceae bacterium]
MFKRILHEDWTSIVPIIAFVVTFTIFIVAIVRSIRMKQTLSDDLASLPLEDDTPKNR